MNMLTWERPAVFISMAHSQFHQDYLTRAVVHLRNIKALLFYVHLIANAISSFFILRRTDDALWFFQSEHL